MKQPTDEQIDNAIDEAFSRPNGYLQNGFIKGVKWLLEWQKTQELQNRCHCHKIEIEPHTCPYKVEIAKDSKTLCRCCSVCQAKCKEDINN